ncbi:MAG: hypothetical protein F8N36_16020 [Desulfovibrio sp.]|uniref:hypothetical protein n=1 Tax=Desulfovibrio sp. TaxID=885 RepID=UPI00135E9B2A|nr:hypothetical protein [Desulfovibrio sp.]MTJ94346.1 hypothetical protein [Desulfovibrio sp.]
MQIRILALGLLLAAMLSNSNEAINLLKAHYASNSSYTFGLALDTISPSVATVGGAALFSAVVPFLYLLGGSLLIVAVLSAAMVGTAYLAWCAAPYGSQLFRWVL